MKLEGKEIKLTDLEREVFYKIFDITGGYGEEPKYLVDELLKDGYNAQVLGGIMSNLIQKNVLWHQGDAIFINPDLEEV